MLFDVLSKVLFSVVECYKYPVVVSNNALFDIRFEINLILVTFEVSPNSRSRLQRVKLRLEVKRKLVHLKNKKNIKP